MDRSADAAIKSGSDAAASKARCVRLGYYEDNLAELMAGGERGLTGHSINNPLINRGYFARVLAVDLALNDFLSGLSEGTGQVVEVGSGKSTLFWRHLPRCRRYFEVDHDIVIAGKERVLSGVERCRSYVQENPGRYQLLACDLNGTDSLSEKLLGKGGEAGAPTLFIFEAVLMYLAPDAVTRVLKDIGANFGNATVVTYDPAVLGGGKAFGNTMIDNLRRSGIDIKTMVRDCTVDKHRERLEAAGFHIDKALDIVEVWDSLLTDDQRKAAASIEMLDEVEEWRMLCRSYCYCVATTP